MSSEKRVKFELCMKLEFGKFKTKLYFQILSLRISLEEIKHF